MIFSTSDSLLKEFFCEKAVLFFGKHLEIGILASFKYIADRREQDSASPVAIRWWKKLFSGNTEKCPFLPFSIGEFTNSFKKIMGCFESLYKETTNPNAPIRRITIGLNNLQDGYMASISLFDDVKAQEKEKKLREAVVDQSDEKLQVEHIMPRTLNGDWQAELGENYEMIHQELVNTIGNLTLIRHNQELGNKKFADKKRIYEENAGLQIAKTEITNHDKWTADAIKERTRWITTILLKDVLPIPDKMRKINNFNQKESRGLSFESLQLIGLDIDFIEDPTICAHVVSDKEVEFEGRRWRFSPLTKEIQTRRGKLNASGAYQGARWWEYDGIRLYDIIY